MKDFEQQIKQLDKEVNKFYKGNHSGHELLEIASRMAALLYYLGSVKSEIHDAFQCLIQEKTKEKGMSVARAENDAHVEYPAMYSLRQRISAGWEIVGIIRSKVSLLKSEMNNRID